MPRPRFGAFAPRPQGGIYARPVTISGNNSLGTAGPGGNRPLQSGGIGGYRPVQVPGQAQEQAPSSAVEDAAAASAAAAPEYLSGPILAQLHNFLAGLPQGGPDAEAERARQKMAIIKSFERQNLPPAARAEVEDIVYQKGRFALRRHKSSLSRLQQGLGAIESAGAGFSAGYGDWLTKHYHTKDPSVGTMLKAMAPWVQYHAIGAGFNHVPEAVGQQYTYADLIKEHANPHSLGYRYATPVGLGMSVLFDPTTYLSFGATSVSKNAAYHLLSMQTKAAFKEADVAIRSGRYGGDFNRLHEAVMDAKVKNGYALDLGDALDQIHQTGVEMKQSIRATGKYQVPTKSGVKEVKAGPLKTVAAWTMPTNVQGGRGIRFAGLELPGTPAAGAKLGRLARGASQATDIGEGLGGGLVSDWAARHVLADELRASSSVELNKFRAAKESLPGQIGRGIRGMTRVSPNEDGTVSVAGETVKMTTGARRGILQGRLEDIPPGPARNLADAIHGDAEQMIEEAAKAGANRDHLEHQWQMMARSYNDPLQALYEFKLKAQTQQLSKEWTTHLLKDRRFAIPMYSGKERILAEKAALEIPQQSGPFRDAYLIPHAKITTVDGKEYTVGGGIRGVVTGATSNSMFKTAEGHVIGKDEILQIKLNTGELMWRKKGLLPTATPGQKLLSEAPHGYTVYTHGTKRYAVLDPIAEALRDTNSFAVQHQRLMFFFKALNKPQDFWKVYATSPNPAFHVMNLLGAMWNNSLAAVYNPANYMEAMATLYQGRKEQAAQEGEKFLFRTPKSTPEGAAAQEILKEAENRTGLGRSAFLFADVMKGNAGRGLNPEIESALKDVGAESDRGSLGKILMPPEDSGAKETTKFYARRGRQAGAAALLGTGNPLGFFLLAPEAARIGQRVTGGIEDVVRLAPFMKYAKDPQIQMALHKFGPIVVPGMKHPGMSKEMQAAMYDIGAAVTRHFQFDYTELSDAERYVAKSAFPFWSYYKKNMALQARELVKQPRKVETALRLMNYMNQQGEPMGPYASILPDYFENIQAFQVPVPHFARKQLGLPTKGPLFINPKMPFLSLNMMPPLWDVINDPHQTTPQKLREMVAPVFGSVGPVSAFGAKTWLEAGTGYNLGLNRPIDYQSVSSNQYRNSYTDAPQWAKYLPGPLKTFFHVHKSSKSGKWIMPATNQYVLEQMTTPFINNLGKSIPVGGATDTDRNKSRADMISWLTGVRLIPFDTLKAGRNQAYTIKNILESKQSDLRQRGKELSPKDAEILQNVRDDIKATDAAYNAREGIK